jgi:hypothetical protein
MTPLDLIQLHMSEVREKFPYVWLHTISHMKSRYQLESYFGEYFLMITVTQTALWMTSTRKPFWETGIDIAMFAEALVSVFRFLPEDEAVTLFSACVEPEHSESVKTCAVRACLTLIQEVPLSILSHSSAYKIPGSSHFLAEIFGQVGNGTCSSIPEYLQGDVFYFHTILID